MGSSSRDFVESYVKDISQDTEAYLAKEQPNYDASKANTLPTPTNNTPKQEQPNDTPPDPSAHFTFHKATTNPMTPASDYTQQQPEQEPQVVWTVRDVTDQRREIHETALVNCSDLHVDLMQCFQHGSWWDKAKMCEDQKQKFWSCFHSQKKFLKAANYKGPISTPEEDDVVLMRALNFRDQQEADAAKNTSTEKGESA
ncbi:hypothetical protein BC941DRAFT_416299 [Chlamydoabsidia padenii]|nr:hypothetical protein BC941DRAFT_416299 [Chlamydoabsidia padenii]